MSFDVIWSIVIKVTVMEVKLFLFSCLVMPKKVKEHLKDAFISRRGSGSGNTEIIPW